MLDYRMDTFLAVCRNMNFTKAAQELNITQPAVSQHIRFLEEVYQIRLFEFKGKKMFLTQEGRMLQNFAMTMKHDDIFFRKELRELGSSNKKLVFGATLTIGGFIITKYVAEFLKCYPDTDIQMTVANTHKLLELLNTGKVDFALIEGYFRKKEYDYLVYSKEPYICVCSADYSFQKEPRLFEDLLGERLIVREPESGTREVLERFMESINLSMEEFHHQSEVSSIDVIKYLTISGCGITFLYETSVKKELEDGILKKVELEDFHMTHDLTFVWRKGSIFAERYYKLFELFRDGDSPVKEKQQ